MTDIHIVAPFIDANGGDWRAIDLYLGLRKKNNAYLWSSYAPHKMISSLYPINEIKPYQGKFPTSGVLYIVGTLTLIGHWYQQVNFTKIIIIHNLFLPEALYANLNRLTLGGKREVEIEYASCMIRDSIGLPGEISYPIPHLERFRPLEKQPATQKSFTIGRISRDILNKHHYADPDFYRKLSAEGMLVKIIGGTCLRPWLSQDNNIKLLPEMPHANIPALLNTFDCFYYRTAVSYKEAFGIAITEAMLCGLPVVCYRQGGYTEIIEHGINGFIFDSEDEAWDIINQLKNDIPLRKTIGENASKSLKHLDMVHKGNGTRQSH